MEKETLNYYLGNFIGMFSVSITSIFMIIFDPKENILNFFIILTIISLLGFVLILSFLIKEKNKRTN